MVILIIVVSKATAQTQQERIYYYHTDHLGTPVMLTDSNQATAWDATYDPFGKASITTAAVTNNLRFPGQYYDMETGLHYNWHRYYWPEVGRYVEADPSINRLFYNLAARVLFRLIDSLKESPQEFNPYHYVFSQPTNLIDLTGLKTCCATFEEYGIQGCCECSEKQKCGYIWPLSTGTTVPLMSNKPPEPPKGVLYIVGVDGDCIVPGGGCGGQERVPSSNCKVYPLRFASTL